MATRAKDEVPEGAVATPAQDLDTVTLGPGGETDIEAGGEKPQSTNETDPNVVGWDGPLDPQNPMNWPDSKKWLNISLLSLLTIVTPLGSSMFAPGIPSIMVEFHSTSSITATFLVSIYILGFAFGPLIVAPLSEIYGRRPLYIIGNILFAVFTVGTALSKSIGMLLAFRLLMGLSGSVPITIGSGSIADIMPVEKRGRAMSAWALGPLLGPIIGPVAGGYLIRAAGWRWVYWLILILSGIFIPVSVMFLQETFAPALLEQKTRRLRKKTGNLELRSKASGRAGPKEQFRLALVRPLKLLLVTPIVTLNALYVAITYGILYLLITTFSFVYKNEYGFDEGSTGLTFIPSGLGMMIGVVAFGQLTDMMVKQNKAKGVAHKPEVRLAPAITVPSGLTLPIGLFIYGWTTDKGVHWIVPMLGVVIFSAGLMGIMMSVQNYLLDTYPTYAASVTAALAVLRSLLGALLPLGGLQMYNSLGLGWGNSLLAFISLALVPIPVVFFMSEQEQVVITLSPRRGCEFDCDSTGPSQLSGLNLGGRETGYADRFQATDQQPLQIKTHRFAVVAAVPCILLVLQAIVWGPTAFLSCLQNINPAANAVLGLLYKCVTAPDGGSAMMGTTDASLSDIAASLISQRELDLVSCHVTQSLWAGYGHICQVTAARRRGGDPSITNGASPVSLILKYISPPTTASAHDEGHIRKILSYQVEQYFYTRLAPQLPEDVAVAECIASINDGKTTALVLKDLRSPESSLRPKDAFSVSLEKRGELNPTQVLAALNWLAGFHGHFWGRMDQFRRENMLLPPLAEASRQRQRRSVKPSAEPHDRFTVSGVWLNGGYTYLATRRKEYLSLLHDKQSEWSGPLCDPAQPDGISLAERVAELLSPASDSADPGPVSDYETLIHGDVKSENMFASPSGEEVAFVDFQYVGLGLGVCDLAKLFTCSVPATELMGGTAGGTNIQGLEMQPGEKALLLHYIDQLEKSSGKVYPWDIFVRHWEAALVDWLRFQASWGFWGNTDWLEARVRHIIKTSGL
ncbi:hypothetical protein JX265_008611 [Neoarthrinium moseri]|uniref:Major facilitator superfamily (MFS) profile domain-containing protein n=1 Tax=Neoarthrinium moseri TaxID=1658444 RepID=A0A9Q0ANI6_9PEZI|nr:hypothetical protein JX265_008611 [Neoarthrinium moseri]